jgi:dTDP-4-amino-4,6-dideoxygalactose transaminase
MKLKAPDHVRFIDTDYEAVKDALDQQELWPYSPKTDSINVTNIWRKSIKALESHFRSASDRELYAIAASSGTGAIHVALGGLQIPAGTEVIVPPITDMGTVMPVIFQNCIPIFADVDPETGLISADTIAARISERTRAVIVVHLMGSPADMDPIMDLCRRRNIKVIEDAAQALGATYKGKPLGTIGDAGAFSLNSQKHITAGEGGFVLVEGATNMMRCLNFSDKHRNRISIPDQVPDSIKPDLRTYQGPGLNYRMSDLEHALLLSQLSRLDDIAAKYTAVGECLEGHMDSIDGITPQRRHTTGVSTYFYVMGRLQPEFAIKREKILNELWNLVGGKDNIGISISPSYGREVLYKTGVFEKRNFFAHEPTAADPLPIWPAELVARKKFPGVADQVFQYDHPINACPVAEAWIRESLLFRFHDGHTVEHADAVGDALRKVMSQL